jgi:hypothetical protein
LELLKQGVLVLLIHRALPYGLPALIEKARKHRLQDFRVRSFGDLHVPL